MQSTDSAAHALYRFGAFELDCDRLELWCDGAVVQADALVLRLLACLVRRAGQLVTKDELVAEVWQSRAIGDNAITVAMARLRKTLRLREDDREVVATVYGRGYRFVDHVTLEPQRAAAAPITQRSSDALFVGRSGPLARLQAAFAEARAGRGRACFLIGEAGIGKTRAVEEFESRASPLQLRAAWGYCREAGDTPPLAPFLRLLRELIGAGVLTAELGDAAVDALRLLDEERLPRPQTASTAGSEFASPGRYRGFPVLLRALTLVAEHTPLMLVLDDLHRADAASLELLSQLLGEISRTKLFLVATLRPGGASVGDRLSRVVGHRNGERIELEPLPRSDVESYVAAVLDDSTGQLAAAVFAKSEGNPFFMVELSRQLRHAASPDPEALSVNDAALDLIRQRVAQLDEAARGVLSAAAVIGRSFELPLLQAVCAHDRAALMRNLDAALGLQVLVAAPDSGTAFAFGHELLRSVLYDALSPADRRAWHIRIANALEHRVNDGAPVPPSELAYHLYAGLPESDLRKTVHFCREAATAASVYGNPDVVRYLRHALEALALMELPSARLRMNLLLTSVVYARGCAHIEYVPLLQRALGLAYEHNDAWTLVRAAYMLNPHPGLEPLPGADQALTRALELIEHNPVEAVETRALGLASHACTAPHNFDAARAQRMITSAVEAGRASGSVFALSGALLCKLYLEGGPAQAHNAALVRELEQLASAHPQALPVVRADLALHRVITSLWSGDHKSLEQSLEELDSRSHQLRHLELSWHAERFAALHAINTHATPEALRRLERAHRTAERYRITGHEPLCAFDRQVVFAAFGIVPPATRDLPVLSPADSDPPSIWSLKVRALATAGQTELASAALQKCSPAQLEALPCDRDYLGTLGHLARASVLLGARDYCEVLYRLLSPYSQAFAGHVSFFNEGAVSQLLGMLADELGQPAVALACYESALERNERAGLGLRTAEARLQLAAAAVQAPKRALGLVRSARADAERMGARPLMRSADSLLARLEVTSF